MEKVKKWYKVLQEVLVDALYKVNVHIQFDHVKLLVYVSIIQRCFSRMCINFVNNMKWTTFQKIGQIDKSEIKPP
jgi:hypothetical protein